MGAPSGMETIGKYIAQDFEAKNPGMTADYQAKIASGMSMPDVIKWSEEEKKRRDAATANETDLTNMLLAAPGRQATILSGPGVPTPSLVKPPGT